MRISIKVYWRLTLSITVMISFVSFPGHSAELSRRYLAVDTSLHGEVKNLDLNMGQAQHKRTLWRQFDAPWEKEHGLQLGALGRVFVDHDGCYRMYYEFMHANAERVTAVAFSEDGLEWTKPALNLAPEIADSPASNLVRVSCKESIDGRGLLDGKWYRGAHAFYDAAETSPAARYKMVWRQGHDIYVAVSPDGLHFNTIGRAVDYYADTSPSHFYDPLQEEYVLYGRIWFDKVERPTIQDRMGGDGNTPVRRGVVLHRTKAWGEVPWPMKSVGEVLIDPIDVFDDDGWTDIYTPNVQVYHGQYIGLPAVFFREVLEDLSGTSGPIYPVFMHSNDGRAWSFPSRSHSIIDLAPHLIQDEGLMEVGMIFPASSVVEVEDEIWIYYSSRGFQHYEESPGDPNDVTYNLATLRKDGFASLKNSGDSEGVWTTSIVQIPEKARKIHVNATIEGSMTVELLSPETKRPLQGYDTDKSMSILGDHTDIQIESSKQNLRSIAGDGILLRFRIKDGEIFSFWFE